MVVSSELAVCSMPLLRVPLTIWFLEWAVIEQDVKYCPPVLWRLVLLSFSKIRNILCKSFIMTVNTLQWVRIHTLNNTKTRPNVETCIKCSISRKQTNPRTCVSLAFISHPMHQPDSLVVFTPFYHFATCHVPFIVYWQTDSQRKEGFVYRQFWLSENVVLSNQLSSPQLFNPAAPNVGRKGSQLHVCVGTFVLNQTPSKGVHLENFSVYFIFQFALNLEGFSGRKLVIRSYQVNINNNCICFQHVYCKGKCPSIEDKTPGINFWETEILYSYSLESKYMLSVADKQVYKSTKTFFKGLSCLCASTPVLRFFY